MANIVQSVLAFGLFTALLEVLEVSGLREPLRHGPYTLLAPLDDAFYDAGNGGLDWLWEMSPEARTRLAARHVIAGAYRASELALMSEVRTLGGERLTVSASGRLRVGDASVLQADLVCDNGVIHVMDRVLGHLETRL